MTYDLRQHNRLINIMLKKFSGFCYSGCVEDFRNDLKQECYIAIIKYTPKYDPELGTTLEMYLYWKCLSACRDYVNYYSKPVRLPAHSKLLHTIQTKELDDTLRFDKTDLVDYDILDRIYNNILPKLKLSNRDKKIFIDYYDWGKTQVELAKEHNLTRAGISIIVRNTIRRIQKIICKEN